jgi:voltage-gated potassium channel
MFAILEHDGMPSLLRRGCDAALTLLIFGWIAEGVFRTMPEIGPDVRAAFWVIESITAAVFAAEFAARIWIAPERFHAGSVSDAVARRHYLLSVLGLVDLAVPAAALIGDRLLGHGGPAVEMIELLAVFKLTRYFPGLDLVFAVLRTEVRPLGAALAATLTLLLLASAAMYFLEHQAQPKQFASIPHAMWWGIVTIATVGYGDMVPVTSAGKLVSGVVVLIGIALFAVPAGILANGFAVELRKRDFIITWRLVARLPIFAGLDAATIATIARQLQPRSMPKDSVVVRRGEPGHAMYFVQRGAVEVLVEPAPVTLGPGDYFGEIALLHDMPRSATVVAASDCELLELGAADFARLCTEYPQLRERVAVEAAARLGSGR